MNFFYNDAKEKVHHEYFPESFKMLIVGQSGAGKTAMLMRLLLTNGLLNYDKLYVFARSHHQAEYQCLMEGFEINGHIDIAKFCAENGATQFDKAMRGAAHWSHWDIVKYCEENDATRFKRAMTTRGYG